MFQVTNTPDAPAAIGPYSQAVAHGGLLFSSGQVPLDPKTGEVVGSDVKEQALQVMKNLSAILNANGIGFENVVKATCFLTDMADFAAKEGIALDPATPSGAPPAAAEGPVKSMGPQTEKN